MSSTKTLTISQPSTVVISVPDPTINTTVTPIIVPPVNQPPVANAGVDQSLVIPATSTSINSTLNGSASKDPEGTSLTYGWRKVSGPAAGTIAIPNAAVTAVNGLVAGTYIFELRVVDALGLFGVDTMSIVVTQTQPPANVPPIANAGPDQTITLPLNSINLDGTLSRDPDGQIKSYKWTQVTTLPCTLNGADTGVLRLTDLQEGNYLFLLTVTDNSDSTTGDQVNVFVKKEIVTPPPTATFPFKLTKNTAWKKRNFAGYENWNGQNYAPFSATWSDLYFRFVVSDFVKGSSATLDWTRFDNEIRKAITNKAKFSFAIFSVNDSDNFLASETYGGGTARYPIAWHNQMQSETVKDFIRNGMWIPNWNSPSFLTNFENLLKEINNRIQTVSFNGVRYKDVINYIDIREYGQWGEWHAVNIVNNVSEYPAGTRPTVASYKKFIDSHTTAFPNIQLVCLFAAYDANWLGHTMTPPEVTDYILKASNAKGLIGWRRDQWGQTDNYIADYLQNNNRSFGTSGPFKNIIMERWKYAPVVGEPYGPGANLADLPNQVKFYHAASIGNGNYSDNNTTSENQFKAAEDLAGYKLSFLSGKLDTTDKLDFDISISVENFGGTCCYEDYTLVYELKNSSNQIVWTNNSSWSASLKQPGVHLISDHYKLTVPISTGTYTLQAAFKSSGDYRRMPLFNNEQLTDGYIILTNEVKL